MSKHTPGPWMVACESGEWFATDSDYCELECSEANACLIAAAPELLEALTRVLMWEPRSTEAACKQDYRFAQAVMAKAEGRK